MKGKNIMVHNDFICKVMHNILLSSGSDLQKLKQQFENSNGFFRKADNAGFEYVFTDISETFQINNVCKDYHLGTLTGHLNDTPDAVGFVLFIKSGYIDTLEGYCMAADNWPDNNFDIFF